MASETPLSDVRFLTVAEVALIMRVSKMTVYRLVHSGELEAIRVGRSFRVPEAGRGSGRPDPRPAGVRPALRAYGGSRCRVARSAAGVSSPRSPRSPGH